MGRHKGLLIAGMTAVVLFLGLLAWVILDGSAPSEAEDGGGGSHAPVRAGLSGLVLDGHLGTPIPRAQVRLTCPPKFERQVRSDQAGLFQLDGAPEGDCVLSVWAKGYLAGGKLERVRLEVGMEAGLVLDDLEARLYQTSRIAGRVLAGKEPVAGARLSVLYLEAPGEDGAFSMDLETPSGPGGEFVAGGLGPGRIRVMAESGGFALAESREVFLKSASEVEDLDIQLRAEATLSGLVMDPVANPVSGAEVRVYPQGMQQALRALSGEDGRFTIAHMPPGEYRLIARAAGYKTTRKEGSPIEVGAMADVEIVLQPVAGIKGRVVGADGRPVPHALVFVELEPAVPNPKPAAHASAGGVFWLPGPHRKARVKIWASHRRHAPSKVLAVDPSSDKEVVLRLGAPGKLTGRVVASDSGKPVGLFEVYAYGHNTPGQKRGSSSGFVRRMVRNAGGKFEIEALAPGIYTLEVQASGYTTARKSGLEVRVGGAGEAGTIYLGSGGTITGRVLDGETGKPIPGARVRAAGMSRTFPRVFCDRQGDFRLTGVPAERLSVWLSARGYVTEMISGVSAPARGEKDIGSVQLSRQKAGKHGAMNYAGMGAVLKMEADGTLAIDRIMDGAPASASGLVSGTKILRIDGLDVADLGLRRAVELIRGEAGTEVTLDVLLPGGSHSQAVRVERDRVQSR